MHMKPAAGSSAKINKAAAMMPKSGHKAPAGKKSGSAVGDECRADMKGAFSNPTK